MSDVDFHNVAAYYATCAAFSTCTVLISSRCMNVVT